MSEEAKTENAPAPAGAAVCGNCRHGKPTLAGVMQCRRYPPTVFVLPGRGGQPMFLSEFPPVKSSLGCGEFSAKLVS